MDMRILIMLLLTSGSVCAQVKIAGHRGGYYHQYPESSFPLFEFIASQFAGDTITIEIDVRTSKDKTLYLMHDETLDRTTTGSGKINDKPDAFLNTLLLKDKNGKETTQRIATLEETLNFIQTRNINLMLDIKEPIHKATLEQVKKHNLENRVLVLTFQKENSRLVAENHPDVLLSALIETEEDLIVYKQLPTHNNKRIAYINNKTPQTLIDKLRAEKILIMADASEDIRNNGKPLETKVYRNKVRLQQLDILISDFPIEAKQALRTN